jgi:Leucine-rich repeat (LRR) protein
LSLCNNQLTGSVPAALGQLTALMHLWLDNNRLTGSVPAALGRLTVLTHLWLDNNRLTSVPAALLQQLRGLRVDVRLDDGVARV